MKPPSRSRTVRYTLPVCAALGFTLLTAPARAREPSPGERESARALADEGADAFARAEYERAHDRLRRAYSLVPAPTIALLDARALAKLGRLLDARAAYERAASTPVDATSPPPFREAVAEARSELPLLDQRLPRLTIRLRNTAPDARVQVFLDDAEVAKRALGAPINVDPKVHSIRLDIDGRQTAVRRVALREGESRIVDLELPSGGGLSRTLTIAGWSLGGAGIITGIVAGVLALDARKKAEAACPNHRCPVGSRGAAAVDDFRTYRTVSTIGYGVGVAGSAVGAILLLAPSKSSRAELGVAPSFQGVDVRGSF
jgi:hypothetical protein